MLTAAELARIDYDAFMAVFGGVVESSPWLAALVWQARPFAGLEALTQAFAGALRGLPDNRQVDVVGAHPDLVGRAALAGTLNPDSTGEQAAAGLDRLSAEDVAEFQRLNAAYRAQFGFPFVICARENRKDAILKGMRSRLENTRQQEIGTAIDEVCKIVRLRLADRVEST